MKQITVLRQTSILKQILVSFLLGVTCISCSNEQPTQKAVETILLDSIEQTSIPKKELNINLFNANLVSEMSNDVISILHDRNNNYWFGTQNSGVYCYDGVNLLRFTVKDGLFQNQVLDIQEDERGNIWFNTSGFGVNYFDGLKINALQNNDTITINDTPNNSWDIEKGDVWFTAGGGAYRYYNKSFSYLAFPKPDFVSKYIPSPANQLSAFAVYSILKDSKGNMWFGTQAMGVCCYDGKSFTWFTDKGLRGPAVLALFEDRKGNLWFGTNGNGLFCYDRKSLTNFTEEHGLSNPAFIKEGKSGSSTMARVWAINEDDRGHLWIGTGDAGAWRYDGQKLIHYSSDNFANSGIETIYKDKTNELWFGTNGAGLYKFNEITFTKIFISSHKIN